MKKFIPAIAGLTLLASSCTKDRVVVPQETPVSKKIDFELYTQHDYSGASFDNAFAEVQLSIAKINLDNNRTAILWDTTYTFRKSSEYPRADQMTLIEKTVDHYENSEALQVSTIVRYRVDGYLSMEAKGEPVLRGQKYKRATVSF